ncbi:uncharacterized protein LOC126733774 [Anthonomus grandis grandis]|uniref:uncharacterized protein LOC126733774 n=1 Tax=Anthonomus grandis grandis TaxID=2921223 RepID=UPI0021655C24|nr:uncharacterized protein LOC126733774 [Anthonomus grandis grandis]
MSGSVMKTFIVCTKLKEVRHIQRRCLSLSSSSWNIRDNILYHPRPVDIPNVSLTEYIFSKIENYADFTAFECALTHRKLTFGEVRKASRNLSKALRKKLGLKKGDVALIYFPNCPEFPVATLACLEAGIVASTVNSLYTPDEISRQLKDSQAKIIITCQEVYANAEKAVASLPGKIPIICARTKSDQSLPQGAIDFTELTNTIIDIPDLDPPSPDDIAILPYSSGTTGLPKGVELSHRNIVSNLCQLSEHEVDFIEKAHGNFQEITPGVLPMFHIYGFTITTLNVMTNGAKVLTLPRFTPETFVNTLKEHPITLIFSAPPLVLFLTHHPEVKKEYLKSLRSIMSGAAPLGKLDEEQFLQKAGNHVYMSQGYGLTETSPVVSTTSKRLRQLYKEASNGSVGNVIANTEVKIVKPDDQTGTPLGPNENGEILVKGPQVMIGYHNNPEATKNAFLGSWLKTGDLGHYDENGLLFITDRVKELIKVRGFQVPPAELEEILRSHPKVSDAAVIGIPHDISGEVPRAYIIPKGELKPEEIYDFVAEKVAKYKKLDGGIELVKEIPKNSAGKILRRQLKQKYLNENQ